MMNIRLNNPSLIRDKEIQNFYDLQTPVILFQGESMQLALFITT